jgi:hypothetical protein
VNIGVEVNVIVGVTVMVSVIVDVCVTVGVAVMVGETVNVSVAVLVGVAVQVGVGASTVTKGLAAIGCVMLPSKADSTAKSKLPRAAGTDAPGPPSALYPYVTVMMPPAGMPDAVIIILFPTAISPSITPALGVALM